MTDAIRANQDLLKEISVLKNRIRELEQREAVHKNTEAELRENEERYRSIIENIEDGYFEVDFSGSLVFFNEPLREIFGYPREELMGMNNRQYTTPETARKIFSTFNEMYRTNIPVKILDYEIIRKDGSIRHLEVSSSLIRDNTGAATGCRGIARDVTERNRELEEKEKLKEQLQRAQKMESIGTLAGGIAHDFNNILAAIMSSAELAKIKTTDTKVYPYLGNILQACKRSRDLVRQILTFSRQQVQEKVPVAMTPIVKEALTLIRASIPSTISIRQIYSIQDDTIIADPIQLHQVLINLCANAVYAMREKGGVLEVQLGQQNFTSADVLYNTDLKEGPYLKLAVSDSGGGIDPSIQDKIFEPFFTTKETGEGTGLGLSVVYGIIKEHNGYVSVESVEGKGTTFTIFLPLIAAAETQERVETVSIPGGKGNILCVDDEESISILNQEMLSSLGYNVTAFSDSSEAMDAFRADPGQFDLVITDMTMPNLTGIDLAGEMMKIRPGIPVILMTGFNDLINEKQAKEMGIKEFFMKPVSISDLAHAVKRIIGRPEL